MSARCKTCCKPDSDPWRVYDAHGRVQFGCIDACHTGRLVTPSASADWHNRQQAKAWRAAEAKRLRLMLGARS